MQLIENLIHIEQLVPLKPFEQSHVPFGKHVPPLKQDQLPALVQPVPIYFNNKLRLIVFKTKQKQHYMMSNWVLKIHSHNHKYHLTHKFHCFGKQMNHH